MFYLEHNLVGHQKVKMAKFLMSNVWIYLLSGKNVLLSTFHCGSNDTISPPITSYQFVIDRGVLHFIFRTLAGKDVFPPEITESDKIQRFWLYS